MVAHSQTLELEKKHINSLIAKDPESAKSKSNAWNKALKEVSYPNLPYDAATGKIAYQKILKFENIDKKTILNRVKEWTAREFGSYESVKDYLNEETGKFIVKGYFTVNMTLNYRFIFDNKVTNAFKCYSNLVFTVKDNAIKIEVLHPELNTSIAGTTIGATYYPSSSITTSIQNYFPITQFDEKQYINYINFTNEINNGYINIFKEVDNYIKDYKNDYGF